MQVKIHKIRLGNETLGFQLTREPVTSYNGSHQILTVIFWIIYGYIINMDLYHIVNNVR